MLQFTVQTTAISIVLRHAAHDHVIIPHYKIGTLRSAGRRLDALFYQASKACKALVSLSTDVPFYLDLQNPSGIYKPTVTHKKGE